MNTQEIKYAQIQNELRNRFIGYDTFKISDIHTIAGVDLAYWTKDNKEYAVCCIVVLDINTKSILEKQYSFGKVEVPYMPSFLSFRELPLILKTIQLLKIEPDIYMFDGNGYLHQRHMGIATHAGILLNKPSIGAKSRYRVDGINYNIPLGNSVGSYADIIKDSEVYGRILRTKENVKPVYLSIGNMISLETATNITMRLLSKESHIPIPTRLADIETHIQRSKMMMMTKE